MSLETRLAALATRVGAECKALWTAVNGKAPTVHGHALTDANVTGIVPDAQLPARLGVTGAYTTDWNLALTNGWYMANGAANAPTTGWYIGEVVAHDVSTTNRYVTQKVWFFTDSTETDSKCYERRSRSTSIWTPWRRVRFLEAELDARYASFLYVQAKGTDLVVNGFGTMGDNTNFPEFTYNTADAPTGAAGSFVSPAYSGTFIVNEFLPVDPNKKLKFSFQIRQTGAQGEGRFYALAQAYDAYKLSISPNHYMYTPGTLTTLAAPLNPGDTTIKLTSSANWYGQAGKPAATQTHLRNIIWWDYVDPGGKLWPELTYSRNTMANPYDDNALVGNTITLRGPYVGPAKPAGTKLSNGSSGGTYMYTVPNNLIVSSEWTAYSGTIGGLMTTGTSASFDTGWPPGVSYAKLGWLLNRSTSGATAVGSQHAVAAVSFSDATAAQDMASALEISKADSTHGHALTDANITGVLPIAQVPTTVYHEGHKPTWAEVDGKPTTFAPTAHGHALTDANMTGILPIAQIPTPASGNASAAQVVRGNDPRLTDARTPTIHTHDDRYYTESESDSRFVNAIEVDAGAFRRARDVVKWDTSTSNNAGDLVITTNLTMSNLMVRVHVQGYNYVGGNDNIDLKIGFYAYSSGPAFINTGATNDGTFPVSQVRLGVNAAGKVVIIITSGMPNAYWQYPKIAVDVILGHVSVADSLFQGWSAVLSTTSTTGITALTPVGVKTERVPAKHWHDPNDIHHIYGRALLHAYLSRSNGANGPCHILYLGSSSVSGSATTIPKYNFVNQLHRQFQEAYPQDNVLSLDGSVTPIGGTALSVNRYVPGIYGWNGGIAATTSANYLPSHIQTRLYEIQPQIVVHMIGSNDVSNGVPVATYIANLNTAINAIDYLCSTPPVHVFVHTFQKYLEASSPEPWNAYRDALKAMVDESPLRRVFVDISESIPSTWSAIILADDFVHLNDDGHGIIAHQIAKSLGINPRPLREYSLYEDFKYSNTLVAANQSLQATSARGGVGPWQVPEGTWLRTMAGVAGCTTTGTALIPSGMLTEQRSIDGLIAVNSEICSVFRVAAGSSALMGVLFRAADNANRLGIFVNPAAATIVLYRTQAGTTTVDKTVSVPSGTLIPGLDHFLKIIVIWDTIHVYFNGSFMFSHTYAAAINNVFAKNSGVGMRITSGDTQSYWKSLTVRPAENI